MIDLLDCAEVERNADAYSEIECLRYHVTERNWSYLAKWNAPTDTTSWLPMMYPETDLRGASMFLSTLRSKSHWGRFVAEIRTPIRRTHDEIIHDDAFDPAYDFARNRVNGFGEFSFVFGRTHRTRQKDGFYESSEWLALRYRVLEYHGGKCGACGRSARAGVTIHVDHVKPRSRYPELELEFSNLQVLCHECNLGKSNHYTTDWRENHA